MDDTPDRPFGYPKNGPGLRDEESTQGSLIIKNGRIRNPDPILRDCESSAGVWIASVESWEVARKRDSEGRQKG
jgi:hypothetical protein